MANGFWAHAQENPGKLALVDPGGREWSAGELLAASNRLVHGLRSAGMAAGDVFSVVLPNGADYIVAYLAAAQAGFYIVPVNNHLVGAELAFILEDSGSKVVIGHERFADVVSTAAEEAKLPPEARFAIGEVPGFRPIAELTDGQPDTLPEDRGVGMPMNYTSGTTGRPRGVRRPLPSGSPEDARYGGTLLIYGLRPGGDNVHLVGSPLYHTAVLQHASQSLHIGHSVVLMDKWLPEEMLRVIERHKVTHTHMVPTQFHRLLQLPDDVKAKYDVSSLAHVVHSAAPCPDHLKRGMIDWWGPVIEEYYAASEGGGTFCTSQEWLERPGTVGKAWPISEVAVFGDDNEKLPPGEVGTVYMLMKTGAFKYHKDEEKTRKGRIGDWFTVGDVGVMDEDGYLFLRDRKIDMIISGGQNIYPAEIEAALLRHPAVGDVAVFGVPDDNWGESVKAVVEPVEGREAGDALADELTTWCAEQLASYKRPRSVDFVATMPRDPNGKLQKRRLRDPYWEGRERAV
ncbi:acyl-CoA synthetase [Yinghuangia sp. YIM S09857]|uniref:acyl-CoA synthetase n=1 Tax=Yinghuangia sp. YIM S09857 TaxID=3436929 RepID=UPI003F52BD6B